MKNIKIHQILLALLALLIAILACAGQKNSAGIITQLPNTQSVILNITQINNRHALYIVDPAAQAIKEWQLQGPNLTKDGSKYCGSGYSLSWSEAEQKLFFAGELACEHGFYLIDAGGAVEQLDLPSDVEGRLGDKGHILSPDGAFVAFIDPAKNALDEHTENIRIIDLQTGTSEQIGDFPAGYIHALSWNAAGNQLLFGHSETTGQHVDALYRINRDGSDLTLLLDQSIDFIRMKWSPDGRYIAYTASSSSAPVTIHILEINAAQSRRLLPPHSSGNPNRGVRDFDWSPNGRQLVFTAGFDTKCVTGRLSGVEVCANYLYQIDSNGNNLTRLTQAGQSTASTLFWFK